MGFEFRVWGVGVQGCGVVVLKLGVLWWVFGGFVALGVVGFRVLILGFGVYEFKGFGV